jgi:hypothetical protein
MDTYQPLLDGYANEAMLGLRTDGVNTDLVTLYQRLRIRAGTARMIARLTRRHRGLLDLVTLLEHSTVCNCAYAGIKPVAINCILGTENRYADFDCDFLPLADHTIHRWLRIAQARKDGIVLPPVELIQAGEVYYIRDGHHRISVARALGEQVIDAEVICLQLEPRVLHVDEASMASPLRPIGLAGAQAHTRSGIAAGKISHALPSYKPLET